MWSLLKTRRWLGFTLVVIVAIAAFGALSSWQWERADEERVARVKLQTEIQVQPLNLNEALASEGREAQMDYRPVMFSGNFLPNSTVLVRQRPLDGRNGLWVVTPMETTDGVVIWVNRGWIPATQSASTVVEAPPVVQGRVQVTGWLRQSETRRNDTDATPASDLPQGQVRWLDTAALNGLAGLTTPPTYVEATQMTPADAAVQALPLPTIDETQNVSYAIQWLVFALVAISGWWFFLRREAREEHLSTDSPQAS
jgi:cytochrome oxidase assembly protein ShyY1